MTGLESLVDRLLDHEVEFVIIGGYAAMAHGASMLTQDVDICCRFNPGNLLRLQKALKGLQPVHRFTAQRLPLQLTKKSCERLQNLYLDTTLGPLDCLGSVTGLGDFDKVLDASLVIDWFGRPCRLLTLEALITAKKAMGSIKDMETVRQLQAIKGMNRNGRAR